MKNLKKNQRAAMIGKWQQIFTQQLIDVNKYD